jgi:site-specific DNA recombinase
VTNPLRAAVYIRVSSTQQEEEGTSLGTPEARCREYASTHGYVIEEGRVYREVHTGVELWERPQLSALREALRRREIDAVVAYAIDRLARDPVHLGVILTEADHAGVQVEFVSEPLDNSPEGQLIRFVRGYAAKVEHEKFRERSLRGRLARAQSGKPINGPRPLYGYQWRDAEKSGLVPDPVTSPVVRRIFAEITCGTSLRGVAFGLTRDGIPSPFGNMRWNVTTVASILHHPAYCGQPRAYRYQTVKTNGHIRNTLRAEDKTIPLPEGTVPPLITEATFHAVQDILTRNRVASVRNNRHPERFLLRGGRLQCGSCGHSMHCKMARPGYPVYYCGGHHLRPGVCPAPTIISTDLLDDEVWHRVESILTQPDIIERELERLRQDDPTEADLALLDAAIADITRRQTNVSRAIARLDDADSEPLLKELASLGSQRRQLEAERDGVLARRDGWEAAQHQLAELERWCAQVAARLVGLDYATKRLALEALGVRVQVWRADHNPRWAITANIPIGGDIASTTTGSC